MQISYSIFTEFHANIVNQIIIFKISFRVWSFNVLPAKECNDELQYTKQLVHAGHDVPGMFTKPEQNHNLSQFAIQCQHPSCIMKFLTKGNLVNSWLPSVRSRNHTAGKFLDSTHWTAMKPPSRHDKHKGMAYVNSANDIQSFTHKLFEHWHRYCDDTM